MRLSQQICDKFSLEDAFILAKHLNYNLHAMAEFLPIVGSVINEFIIKNQIDIKK